MKERDEEREGNSGVENKNKAANPIDIAVNPNPRANANIKEEIKDKTPDQLKEEKSQPDNEITDGEDG